MSFQTSLWLSAAPCICLRSISVEEKITIKNLLFSVLMWVVGP